MHDGQPRMAERRSDGDLLLEVHEEVDRASRDCSARQGELDQSRTIAGGNASIATGEDVVYAAIVALTGLSLDAVATLYTGAHLQILPVAQALAEKEDPRAALIGLWVDGFAHGKRFAEKRAE